MNRVEAIEFAKEQRAIFGGRMGDFLKFVEDELAQTTASHTLNALDSVDLISRQAAIDAPEEFIKDCNPEHFIGYQKFIEFMDNAEIGSFGNWQFANGFNMGLTAAEVAIKELPSAPRWIPVTERLPEEERDVLCFTIHHTMLVASYGKLYPLSDEVGWITNEYNRLHVSSVTAWMPLPEPYEE